MLKHKVQKMTDSSSGDVEDVTGQFSAASLSPDGDTVQDDASDHSGPSDAGSRGSHRSSNGSKASDPPVPLTVIGHPRKSSVSSETDLYSTTNTEESPPSGTEKTSKTKNPLQFFRRLTSKDKKGDKKEKLSKFDKMLMEVKVDTLPQIFVTKYMGCKPCHGLWGIKHTRGPVEEMISEVTSINQEESEDLPLVQLKVSVNGIHVKEHSANMSQKHKVEKGLIPIEFISYGVQDIRYTRVFTFILVREMSSKNRKLECHAYVCDSTANCRKLSLSVALAFTEYSKKLEGKPFKFQVDLRPAETLEEDLQTPDTEDFEV